MNLHNYNNIEHNVVEINPLRFQPFYNDYYALIYLKGGKKYLPILISDKNIIKSILNGATVLKVHNAGNKIIRPTYNFYFEIQSLSNGLWCLYIEKISLWDYFHSSGVITIVSNNYHHVIDYFTNKIIPKFYKK